MYTASGKKVKIVEKSLLHGEPNSVTQLVNEKGGVDRNFFDSNGRQYLQISNNGHSHLVEEDIGEFGEHAHDYAYDENGNLIERLARELTDKELKENGDIL